MKIIQLTTLCGFIGFILLVSGCQQSGLKTNVVEGIVLWNDQPVVGASVSFQPLDADGIVAVGTTDERGHYVLTTAAGEYGRGTVAGRYKVLISKIPDRAIGRPSRTTELPGIYAENTSPLEAEVVAGKNKFDFTLEGTAPPPAPRTPEPPSGPPPRQS